MILYGVNGRQVDSVHNRMMGGGMGGGRRR